MNKYFLISFLLTLISCKSLDNKKVISNHVNYVIETKTTSGSINNNSFNLTGKWSEIKYINETLPVNPHCIGLKDDLENEIEITIYHLQELEKSVNHNTSIWEEQKNIYTLLKESEDYKIFEVTENNVSRLRLLGVNKKTSFYITHFNKNKHSKTNISIIENIFEQIK